ncbi:MAG: ATP-binding protein [Pseudomonadota bacterium]
MKTAASAPLHKSLAAILVKRVFAIYLFLAFLLTTIQLGLSYRDTYGDVLKELDASAQALESGVSDALWNYQKDSAQLLVAGLLRRPEILAVEIQDNFATFHAMKSKQDVSSNMLVLKRHYPLFITLASGRREPTGSMTLYSSHAAVIEKFQYSFLVILLMAVLKTAGLWAIIVFCANRLLADPLRRFTSQIQELDVSAAATPRRIDLGDVAGTELVCLRDGFNDLVDRVMQNKDALVKLTDTLEERVGDRTRELEAKNQALENEIEARLQADIALQDAQRKLVDTARMAGRAEVAINVLHNVGNGLNSVNASANLLRDLVRNSKADGLSRAVQMLNAEGVDLSTFLTSDPRGKMIPQYLSKAALVLKDEQRCLLDELEQLSTGVGYIANIIAAQQAHARGTQFLEPLRVDELIEEALHVSEALMTRPIRIVKELSPIPACQLDKSRMLQILVNLLTNAMQAIDRGAASQRVLGIRTELVEAGDPAAARIRIAVSDTGDGIDAENLTRIFSHGFTTRKDGHGFGLHSCANAATEMKGVLAAHSDGSGRGACFVLEVPFSKVPLPAEAIEGLT